MATRSLNVNGRTVSVAVDDPDTPLLYVLRNELGLHGPRFGCGLGQCGACTVHVDGAAVRSCVTPLSSVTGRIVTLEGLGTDAAPHPIQQAFIDEQAVQCGYCINGMIMQSAAFLARNPKPSEQQIKAELAKLDQEIAQLNGRRRKSEVLQAIYDLAPPTPTHVLKRGVVDRPGAEVGPGFFSVLAADADAPVQPAHSSSLTLTSTFGRFS